MYESLLQWLGYGLCHQLPERSFFGGGFQVPVCARDEGIYLGFVIAAVVIWLLHRPARPRRLPSRTGLVVIGVLFATMVLDGVMSYAGLRETTNLVRIVTGFSAGYAIAAIVMPLLDDEVWMSSDDSRVLDPPWRLGVWLASIPVALLVSRLLLPLLGPVYPLVVSAAIVATYMTVNLLLVATLAPFERRAERARDLAVPLFIAFLLMLVEFAGAALLKLVLLSLTS